MPRKIEIAVGDRFAHLTIICETRRTPDGKRQFRARCDCGRETTALLEKLRQDRTKICGCRKGRDSFRKDPLYSVWCGMIKRCADQSNHRYGGRGIHVCALWRNSFIEFRDWSRSHGYEPGLQIDRENNDGNYEPSNCRWVTHAVKQLNKGGSAPLAWD
jgi:hypothetical protein